MMDDNVLDAVLCIMVKPGNAKEMRNTLFSHGVMDKTKKTIKCGDDVAIPIRTDKPFKHFNDVSTIPPHVHVSDKSMKYVCMSCRKTFKLDAHDLPTTSPTETCQCDEVRCSGVLDGIPFHVAIISQNFKKKHFPPVQRLEEVLSKILANHNISLDDIKVEFPNNWERHGDLVLLPSQSLAGEVWKKMTVENWQQVVATVGGKRLARSMGAIQRDGFRTPNVELLLGDNGWVEHVDNGIRYGFDVTKCMFSSGNITEKIRVAKMKCDGETIVDLYAGIGYFTLPYLVHANAAFLHACEWNPNAVNALKRNLVLNKVQDRCTVYEGDNRQTCPSGVADRVNLGLIPTSTAGWPVACRALKSTGGILHIHGNVSSPPSRGHSACLSDSNSMLENIGQTLPSSGLESDSLDKQADKEHINIPNCEHSQSIYNACSNGTDSRMVTNNRRSRQEAWKIWSHDVSRQIKQMCVKIRGGDWSTKVLHIEKVKSYAPHIDHIVVDLECRPLR